MNYAESYDGILACYREMGRPVPEDVRQPEITPEAAFILAAFDDLTGDRSIGMGVGPIPWTAIRAWAEVHGWADPDDLAFLVAGVRAVDVLWLEAHRPKKGG